METLQETKNRMERRMQELANPDIKRLRKMSENGVAMGNVLLDAKYGLGDYKESDAGEAPEGN